MTIDRESAWCLLTEFTQSESLRKHALSVEACMRAYARKFAAGSTEEEELWGVVGLLHDFDYEKYPSLDDHPYKGNEILKERGYPDEIRRAIMSHAEYTGVTSGHSDGKSAVRLRRTRRIHHRRRADQAGKVFGRGRRKVSTKENERQSLRTKSESRRHRKRRRGFGRRSGRAHHILHRSAKADRGSVGAGRKRGENRLVITRVGTGRLGPSGRAKLGGRLRIAAQVISAPPPPSHSQSTPQSAQNPDTSPGLYPSSDTPTESPHRPPAHACRS